MIYSIRKILFIMFSLMLILNINAQNPISKKAKKQLLKGIRYFNKHKFNKALKYFDKALNKEPKYIKAHLYKASAFYELLLFDKSEIEYNKIIKIDSNYSADLYYSLAVIQEKQSKLEKALVNYIKFIKKATKKGRLESKASKKINNLPFIIKAKRNPVSFHPIPVGDGVNTRNSEYLPSITGDNLNMIFTRRINRQEDFYISKFKNGRWQKAKPIKELNTLANEGIHTLSSDGKTLIFTICGDKQRTYGGCDLFISKKENSTWSKPKNLGKVINSPYWDSQPSLSSDGKTLYFSSDRPGGIGGKDIWVSYINQDKNWTRPICLDSTINTRSDDLTPFIHSDNVTLYFTSSGHPGMGGKDLFYSKYKNGKWSKAINLGYPINTENEEGALFVSLDGKSGYFSSDRTNQQYHNLDIFYFEMPKKIRPQNVTFVKGIVFDNETLQPLDAIIKLSDNNTGKELQTIKSNKDSFLVSLPIGIDYNLTVEKEGFAYYSERFVLDTFNTALNPRRVSIGLVKLTGKTTEALSDPIVLNNLIFEINSSEVDLVKSKIELNNLTALLTNNPDLKIEIIGHTDNTGNKDYNLKLSKKRAKSLFNYLLKQNIDKNRIQYTGYGETQPIAPNDTPKNKSKNRRVEFRIIQN